MEPLSALLLFPKAEFDASSGLTEFTFANSRGHAHCNCRYRRTYCGSPYNTRAFSPMMRAFTSGDRSVRSRIGFVELGKSPSQCG